MRNRDNGVDVVRADGVLRLEMGPVLNTTWATDPADAPLSVSEAPLSAFGCRKASGRGGGRGRGGLVER